MKTTKQAKPLSLQLNKQNWIEINKQICSKEKSNSQLSLKDKKIIVKDYSICKNIFSKMRGLMFRKKNYARPLLFIWKNPDKRAIHSFFCRKFLAIWIIKEKNKTKIIDERIIEPFKSCVIPKKKFNLLLEIHLAYFLNTDGKAKV